MSKVDLGIDEIKKLLPHRYPLLLIDHVIDIVPMVSCVAIKNTTYNEDYFQGHFPSYPIFPGIYQIEALAQAAGISLTYGNNYQGFPLLAKVRDAKFRKPIFPGSKLIISTETIQKRGIVAIIRGKIESYYDNRPPELASEIELTLSLKENGG